MAANNIDGVDLERCGPEAFLTGPHPMRSLIKDLVGAPNRAMGYANTAATFRSNYVAPVLERGLGRS